MFVSGVGMCLEFISSHPPGRTARSLIYNCVIIKSTHGIYIFSLTISSMINRTLLDQLPNVFSASFDNGEVGKYHLTLHLMSAVSQNVRFLGIFDEIVRFLKSCFHDQHVFRSLSSAQLLYTNIRMQTCNKNSHYSRVP